MTSQKKVTLPKPICELTQWQLSATIVRGIVKNTTEPKEYPEGAAMIVTTISSISHYPKTDFNDGEYWLCRTQLGSYFKIYATERLL